MASAFVFILVTSYTLVLIVIVGCVHFCFLEVVVFEVLCKTLLAQAEPWEKTDLVVVAVQGAPTCFIVISKDLALDHVIQERWIIT